MNKNKGDVDKIFYKTYNPFMELDLVKDIWTLMLKKCPHTYLTKIIWHKLPYSIRGYISSKLGYTGYNPPGWVDFGDFRRVTPIGNYFGHDRGKPIDRYYIENFLASNSFDIKGRVLEIEDNTNTLRYGKNKVTKSDILNLSKEENPATTIEADVSSAPNNSSNSFDCIIFTQTLQFTYNLRGSYRYFTFSTETG